MSGFTEEEVDASVDQFLLREVTVPLLPGALRDVGEARERIFDLLTIALVLKPEAFFHVLGMAKNAVRAELVQQIADVDSIVTAAPDVSRAAKLVKDTSSLTNARAAIINLTGSFDERTAGVSDSLGPHVERFRSSIEEFVSSQLVPNVAPDGTVIPTADEQRTSIFTTWSTSRQRHTEILTRVQAIVDAVADLGSVQLSYKTVGAVLSRMEDRLVELEASMKTASAVRDSRLAMLDLLAMRTLISKLSSYRELSLLRVPQPNDSDAVTFVDSAGTEASVTGTISGPYNYAPSTVLGLLVNGGTPVNIALPGNSNAEVRSATLDFTGPPIGPPAVAELAVLVNHTTTVVVPDLSLIATPAPWATGVIAAAALDVELSPLVDVSWDAVEEQLVFRTASTADSSALVFLNAPGARANFMNWAFAGGYPSSGRAAPVELAEVLTTIGESTTLVRASKIEVIHGTFDAIRTSPTTDIDTTLLTGSDGVAAGSTLTSASVHFQARKVTPGMRVRVTAPGPSVGTYEITEVANNVLTTSVAIPAAGGVAFEVGPNLTAAVGGTRVKFATIAVEDIGWYRVVSYPSPFVVRLDRDVPVAATDIRATFYTQFLKLEAVGTTTTSGLGVAGSVGATAVGLAVAAETPALLTELTSTLSFATRGVVVGDLVTITTVTPAATYSRVVAAVDGTRLTLDTPVPYNATATIRIVHGRVSPYDDLVEALEAVELEPLASLDQIITRLVRGAKFVPVLSDPLVDYRAELQALITALDGYAAPTEPSITAIVKMMTEQGFDRALDLLTALQFSEIFSMDRDGVSYASNVIRKSATAARKVVPVSKYARNLTIFQEIRPISYQVLPYDITQEEDQ